MSPEALSRFSQDLDTSDVVQEAHDFSDAREVTEGIEPVQSAASAKDASTPLSLPEREPDWFINPDHHIGGEAA